MLINEHMIEAINAAERKREQEMQPFWDEIAEAQRKRDDALFGLRDALESTKQQMADQYAKYDVERKQDTLQRKKDKKESLRHDFYVAAFSVAFSLFVEHFSDVKSFFQQFVANVISLFQ